MDLVLWRHAEAEPEVPGTPDLSRSLTSKGRKQARKMGEWLDASLPANCRILVSPALRTVQTAEALERKFRIEPALGPEMTVATILAAIDWPQSRDTVLIVGHQPSFGQLAATLIGGASQDWTIRKANVWWITHRDQPDEEKPDDITGNYLRAVIAPELLRK